MTIVSQPLNEFFLTELFAPVIYCFGNSIGVKSEQVSGRHCEVGERALPVLEKTHQSCRGVEPAQGVARAQNKAGEVSAVSIAEAGRLCVVFSEKQRSVGPVDGIPVEEVVDRTQKEFGLRQGESALTAQVRLQVGHEQSGGDAFPRDVNA